MQTLYPSSVVFVLTELDCLALVIFEVSGLQCLHLHHNPEIEVLGSLGTPHSRLNGTSMVCHVPKHDHSCAEAATAEHVGTPQPVQLKNKSASVVGTTGDSFPYGFGDWTFNCIQLVRQVGALAKHPTTRQEKTGPTKRQLEPVLAVTFANLLLNELPCLGNLCG